ncbi:hypothetical protein KKG22_03195 [Patescibacteria group bacterium]|nr:hypothetical protein [Patescibacteria group bacterium]
MKQTLEFIREGGDIMGKLIAVIYNGTRYTPEEARQRGWITGELRSGFNPEKGFSQGCTRSAGK